VALHDGARWSVVVETLAATAPQRLAFALSGGLARTPAHVWRSDARRWFEEVAVLRPVAGRFALTVAPGSVYTLTSTTGQHKGAVPAPPPERAFPMPWREDFERARFGTTPAYISDLNCAFEIAPCPGRTSGCLHQRITVPPTPRAYWRTMREAGALTVAGDPAWRDYRVSADVRLDGPGYASLIGRISKLASDGPLSAYQFRLYDDGRWQLLAATTEGLVAQGVSTARAEAWHRLALTIVAGQSRAQSTARGYSRWPTNGRRPGWRGSDRGGTRRCSTIWWSSRSRPMCPSSPPRPRRATAAAAPVRSGSARPRGASPLERGARRDQLPRANRREGGRVGQDRRGWALDRANLPHAHERAQIFLRGGRGERGGSQPRRGAIRDADRALTGARAGEPRGVHP